MIKSAATCVPLLVLLFSSPWPALAWDYEAHRVVNQLALASLPTNFPAFVQAPAARERIAFLAGEMDRWRNTPDLALKHLNNPEHYLDFEELKDYALDPMKLPVFRYDFVAELALIRKQNPDKFPPPALEKNQDRTLELIGFLPWGLTEHYGKLKSGFSYLKAYREDGGTAEEIANAEANIIYIMGVMGHLAGDASQPLHSTVHHHGWVGSNPNKFTTSRSIHSWIDGGFFQKTGGVRAETLQSKIRPAAPVTLDGRVARPEEIFRAIMQFFAQQHQLVERLYQMEKDGKFSEQAEQNREGREFLEGQLVRSGQLLGDLWLSAYEQAPADTWLKGQLARRKTGG